MMARAYLHGAWKGHLQGRASFGTCYHCGGPSSSRLRVDETQDSQLAGASLSGSDFRNRTRSIQRWTTSSMGSPLRRDRIVELVRPQLPYDFDHYTELFSYTKSQLSSVRPPATPFPLRYRVVSTNATLADRYYQIGRRLLLRSSARASPASSASRECGEILRGSRRSMPDRYADRIGIVLLSPCTVARASRGARTRRTTRQSATRSGLHGVAGA